MTTLDKDRKTNEKVVLDVVAPFEIPVAAAIKLFGGSLCCTDASGNLTKGAASTTLTAAGRLESVADNTTGAAGDIKGRVKPGIYDWDNSADSDEIGEANRFSVCYVVDDHTVALTDGSGTRSKAGVILGVEGSKVWVATGFSFLSNPAATPSGTFFKRTVSLDATITGSADTNGTANTPTNVGAVLPANAIVVGIEIILTTPASGGSVSAANLDVGYSGGTETLLKDFDLVAKSAGTYDNQDGTSTSTRALPSIASAKQLTAIVTPDGSHKLSDLTALAVTINVYGFVAF